MALLLTHTPNPTLPLFSSPAQVDSLAIPLLPDASRDSHPNTNLDPTATPAMVVDPISIPTLPLGES